MQQARMTMRRANKDTTISQSVMARHVINVNMSTMTVIPTNVRKDTILMISAIDQVAHSRCCSVLNHRLFCVYALIGSS